MMIRLIYASRAVNLGPADVKDILASSRKNNQQLAVTGALSLSNGIFLQCLEGGAFRCECTLPSHIER